MTSNFLILIVLIKISLSLADDPLVELPNGVVKGREATTIENKSFFAFEGIPYAAAPVGELRFQPPQPAVDWDDVLDATSLQTTCFERCCDSEFESEDCLFINIYTPQLPSDGDNVSLPVMFYIHGGGFVDGTSAKSPDLFINNDVILASINYRVSIFGFLSTQDEVVPGNNGLKDQQFAIQWAHDNIHLFGGDPNKITIFGQSAGSASCAYQLLNQNNNGLFQAAILESGSFLSPWAFQRNAREIAFATATILEPSFAESNDSQALLDYLKTVDARTLDGAAMQFYNIEYGPQDVEIHQGFYFAPVVEEKNPDGFLTKKMYGLLNAGNVVSVPIMIGITSEENLAFNTDANNFQSLMSTFDQNLGWVVPNDMVISDPDQLQQMGESIRQAYTEGAPWADQLGLSIGYCSDTSFTRSLIKHAELHSKVADTYFYQFSYDGQQISTFNVYYEGGERVAHSEELNYLFCSGGGCNVEGIPEADVATRQRLIKLWTDFAKFQNPTPEASDLLQNVIWPAVVTDNGDFNYLDINENLEIKNHPKEFTYKAWSELYDSLNYTDFDTY